MKRENVKKSKSKGENAAQAKRRRKSTSTKKIGQSARKAEIARGRSAPKTGEAKIEETEEKGEKEQKEEIGERDTITTTVATARIDIGKIVIVREKKRKSAVSAVVQERKIIAESNVLVPGTTRIIVGITDSMWQTPSPLLIAFVLSS